MKTIIYYDCTRFLTHIDRLFPSGIERVDANYFSGLVRDERFELRGVVELVVKNRNYIFQLDQEILDSLCTHFFEKWVENKVSNKEFSERARYLREKILRDFDKKIPFCSHGIDASLASGQGNSHFYFNATFINIPDGAEHERLIRFCGFKPVYLVHDLIPIEFPEYTAESDERHLGRLLAALNLNGRIIAISNAVREKIIAVASAIGRQIMHDIEVIQNGTNECFIRAKSPSLPRANQFLFLSTIEPRKNLVLLLNVWRALFREIGDESKIPRLVIIGRRGWNSQPVFDILDKAGFTAKTVVEINDATDDEIIGQLKRSHALLFPSFDEGWGLPAVESLSVGTPVICSDISVFRECTQGIGVFLDPIDAIGWKNLIIEVTSGRHRLTAEGFEPIRWASSIGQLRDYFLNG